MAEDEQRDPSIGLRDRFALNLREARLAAGVTQEELAERCGLHWTMVARMETGGQEPRLGTLLSLASTLKVAPDSLWTVRRT